MISTESRMISGLRRTSTPSAPATNRIPESATYQVTSGPCMLLLAASKLALGRVVLELPRVRAEHDAADGGDEQHDRRHLEGDQVVGEEEPPDRLGRAEVAADVRLVR